MARTFYRCTSTSHLWPFSAVIIVSTGGIISTCAFLMVTASASRCCKFLRLLPAGEIGEDAIRGDRNWDAPLSLFEPLLATLRAGAVRRLCLLVLAMPTSFESSTTVVNKSLLFPPVRGGQILSW